MVVVFTLMFFGVMWKSTGFWSVPTFWSEDGAVFFAQQLGQSMPRFFTPYSGYLHTLIRAVAWAATPFPLAWQPQVYAVFAIIISAAALTFVVRRLAQVIPPVIVAGSFLLSWTNAEVYGYITNVHWFTGMALAVLVLVPSIEGARGGRAGFFVALLLGLTGPFCLVLVPIVLAMLAAAYISSKVPWSSWLASLRVYAQGLDRPAMAGFLLASVIQMSVLAASDGGAAPYVRPWQEWTDLLLFWQLPVHLFAGLPAFPALVPLLLVLLVVALLCGRRIDTRTRLAILLPFAFAVAVGALAIATISYMLTVNLENDRYFLGLKAVVWWLIWGALAANWSRSPQALTVSVMATMLAWAVMNIDHLRRPSPWDAGWAAQAASLKTPGIHRVFVGKGPGWSFEVQTLSDGSMHGLPSHYWSRTRKLHGADPFDALLRGPGDLEDGKVKGDDHTADQRAKDDHDKGL